MSLLAEYKELVLWLAALAWGVACFKRRPRWLPWLGAQLLIAILVETAGKWMGQNGMANQWLYNTYMIAEFTFLSFVLLHLGTPLLRQIRLVLGIAAFVFVTFLIWDVSDSGTFHVFASNTLIMGGFLLGAIAAWVLLTLAVKSHASLIVLPEFWVLIAIMGYFLCTAPMFGLYNHFSEANPALGLQVYRINDILFVLRYGLTAAGLALLARTPHA